MRIITVSRQFGSGGRELGKRLSDILGWDYYDKEIIQKLSEDSGLDEGYIDTVLTNHEWQSIPLSYNNSFAFISSLPTDKTSLLIQQRKIIESIAQVGHDCIIVGRDADIILSLYKPFRLFVCADMDSRIARTMGRENDKEDPRLTEKEIARNIRKIDKERAQVRQILSGKDWGEGTCFDLTVNTRSTDIKALSQMVADYALKWFELNGVT